jgi:hypothetical protein
VVALAKEGGASSVLIPNSAMGGAAWSPVWTRGLREENWPWCELEGEEWGAGKGK